MISGIVGAGYSVTAGSASAACGSQHSCYASGTGAITVEAADDPGVMAIGLSHEYAHSTEKTAVNTTQYGRNELRAWDESRKVFNGLRGSYKSQATAVFGNNFQALAPGTSTRSQQLQIWINDALKKYGPP